MRSAAIFFGVFSALFALFAAEAQTDCTGVLGKCMCNEDKPLVLLMILDVSKSIDEQRLFDVYVESMRQIYCGLNLGTDNNGETGKDAVGLLTFGYDIKVRVPVKQWSESNWLAALQDFTQGNPSTDRWGSSCCTPLAAAFDLADEHLHNISISRDLDVENSRVLIHVITDGFPIQNRLRDGASYNEYTQEKMYPSYFKLQLVPEKAKILKDTYNATINLLLIEHQRENEYDRFSKDEARNYFQGIDLVSESSRKRKANVPGKAWKGKKRDHVPLHFPIVSAPVNLHSIDLDDISSSSDVVNAQVQVICQENTIDVGPGCEDTRTITQSPTPSPIREVQVCRGDKDLIFVVDSSNSISRMASGRQRRFREFVLQIAEDLQRIQAEFEPRQRTGLITFSKTIQERIPLSNYSYSQWSGKIDEVRDMAEDIVGCCTPTAEAFRAAREMIENRQSFTDNDVIVFFITDGDPVLNKAPYESVNGSPEGIVQFRRDTGRTQDAPVPGGPSVSLAEYASSIVFKEAADLNALSGVETFLVGIKNRGGSKTSVDYFNGEDINKKSCRVGSFTNCKKCHHKKHPCKGKDQKEVCWMIGSTDHECSAFYGPLVQQAVTDSSKRDDLDALISELRDFICQDEGQ